MKRIDKENHSFKGDKNMKNKTSKVVILAVIALIILSSFPVQAKGKHS